MQAIGKPKGLGGEFPATKLALEPLDPSAIAFPLIPTFLCGSEICTRVRSTLFIGTIFGEWSQLEASSNGMVSLARRFAKTSDTLKFSTEVHQTWPDSLDRGFELHLFLLTLLHINTLLIALGREQEHILIGWGEGNNLVRACA